MGRGSGELVFAGDNDPAKGFTNTDANRDLVKDETVIRELVQNALDSGSGVRTVRFVLADVPIKQIFGLSEYRAAFEAACRYLGADEPATGRQMINRIEKALRSKRLRCLVCCDNGEGIGEQELRALYGSGRSTKRASGRGSVGHGHLTAFVPSDLRYVLYAGQRLTSEGNLSQTFGGHAIVATHVVTSGNRRTQRSADGYIREKQSRRQSTLFDVERGGDQVPAPLASLMPSDESGSAVMITAYNPVVPIRDIELMVLAASTRHFLVAVFDGSLVVKFQNSTGIEHTLDPRALQAHVNAIRPDRNHRSALRTLRTLQDPSSQMANDVVRSALGDGVRIWIRPRLRGDEPSTHRVSVFRDGMWIQDNTTNYLQPRHFSGTEPFDAVIDLDSTMPNSMGALVREAEGASHLQITPSELNNPSALVDCFSKLRELLIANARQTSTSEPYAPPQLRLTGTSIDSSPMPRRRPKRPAPEPSVVSNGGVDHEAVLRDGIAALPAPPHSASDALTQDPDDQADTEKTDRSVRPGTSTGLSTSCRPDPQDICVFHVAWSAAGRGFRSGATDLSLVLPSGTDQTSRHRIAPGYLTIASVRHQGQQIDLGSSGRKQVRIANPRSSDSATVHVAEAEAAALGADRGLVEAVLFHRLATTTGPDRP